MTRLAIAVGALLVVGLVISLAAPPPSIFSTATAPVPPDELWRLNPD